MQFARRNRVGVAVACAIAIFVGGLAMLAWAGDGSLSARAYWQKKWEYFDGTAEQAISMGDTLSINRITGLVGKADADSGVSTFIIGLAGNTAAKGASVQIVTSGILAGLAVPAWGNNGLTPYGAPVFASTTAGGVTVYGAQNPYEAGVSIIVGTVLPRSEYAAESGVTSGSDRIRVNIPWSSGVSPLTTGELRGKSLLAKAKALLKWKVTEVDATGITQIAG